MMTENGSVASGQVIGPAAPTLIPVGKYKGQPVEALLADPGYRDWIMAQDWFRARFPTIYQTVINFGGESQDTPEHNEMQVAFLADDLCVQVAELVCDLSESRADRTARSDPETNWAYGDGWDKFISLGYTDPSIYDREFEKSGWDVVFNVEPRGVYLDPIEAPACLCVCDHGSCGEAEWSQPNNPTQEACEGGAIIAWCNHRRHEGRRGSNDPYDDGGHCNPVCPWKHRVIRNCYAKGGGSVFPPEKRILVELKPDLGDDFPTVLRQVNSHDAKSTDRRVVVVRRSHFERVTWADVVAMFKASGITLLTEETVLHK